MKQLLLLLLLQPESITSLLLWWYAMWNGCLIQTVVAVFFPFLFLCFFPFAFPPGVPANDNFLQFAPTVGRRDAAVAAAAAVATAARLTLCRLLFV